MEFRLSEHAKTELIRRQISEDFVMQVTHEPHQIVPVRNGLECRQARFLDDSTGREYLLRVIVNSRRTPNVIVTVYKTSKVEKYWRV